MGVISLLLQPYVSSKHLEWDNHSACRVLSWWREFSSQPLTELFRHHILSACQLYRCVMEAFSTTCVIYSKLWELHVCRPVVIALAAQAMQVSWVRFPATTFYFPLILLYNIQVSLLVRNILQRHTNIRPNISLVPRPSLSSRTSDQLLALYPGESELTNIRPTISLVPRRVWAHEHQTNY